MENIKRVSFLKKVNIFAETPEELLHQIAENLIEMEFSRGDHIVLKGELGDSMYIVIDGLVKVHDGDYIFSVLKKGDVFGKYYLLDRKERSATVTALEQTQLFCFKQEIFYEITRNEGTIIQGILRELVRRLRDMNLAEEQMAIQNQEIIRQKETLEKQKKELLELNATKDKFFSIIAHDLRSPISVLITLSEVLKTDMDLLSPEKKNEILDSLHNLSLNYLKLLDNLLQWATAQSGRMNPEPSAFSLSASITEVMDFYQANARKKNITLEYIHTSETNVFADKNMIRTVLRNLISNGIKYSLPGGTIRVSVEENSKQAKVKVRDNGIGMSAEHISRLFCLDQSHSTKGTANEPGTGLGLILCKEFVEKNGGILNIFSELGNGSTFEFTLPIS